MAYYDGFAEAAALQYEEQSRLAQRAQHQPGAKLDDVKVDLTFFAVYFPQACEAVCRVAAYGADKYCRGGWRTVADGFHRYTKALFRHLFKIGKPDPVPGLPPNLIHDAQVAWNALARLEFLLAEERDEAPIVPGPVQVAATSDFQLSELGSFIHVPQVHPTQAMQAPEQAFQGSI